MTLLLFVMVRVAGAVFASGSGHAATAGGVLWAVVLPGEALPWTSWIALALLVVGLALVRPRREEPDLDAVLAGNPKLRAARARLGP